MKTALYFLSSKISLVFLRREVALLIEVGDNLSNSLLDGHLVVLDVDLRVQGRLVGSADTGEFLDDALARLLVQALGVARLSDLDGDVDEDFDKGQAGGLAGGGRLVQPARRVPISPVRRDEGGDGDAGAVGEQLGHLGDAPDVLVAVLLAEAQVLVQPEPDVVAVQPVRGHAALAQQLVLQLDRDGRLARRREAGQPDGEALLPAEAGALRAGDSGGMVGDVSRTKDEKKESISWFVGTELICVREELK